MPTRSGRYVGRINTLTVTPNGGTTVAYEGLVKVHVTGNEQNQPFQTDASLYPNLIVRVGASRGLAFEGHDVSKFLRTLPPGPATIVAKISDAVNAPGSAGSGQITYTLVNAMRGELSAEHKVAGADSATVSYTGYHPDGVTDPLTITEE